jgi:uncharacterized membrane protein YgcG
MRSLHWKRLDVTARLDADGRLRVEERHHMVFTGDWNGGERGFRLADDHVLTLAGIEREDLSTHTRVPLRENGSLTSVDDYAWKDSKTLRWRSRLPTDPPFENAERVYVIDYTLENVLIPEGSRYLLDHDFAFPDRPGTFQSFSLELSLDPAWSSEEEIPDRITRENLKPGMSVVMRVPLVYLAAGAPSGVRLGAPAALRYLLLLAFLVGVGAIGFLFYRGEDDLGRFAPLTPMSEIDRGWLEAHIFTMLPEEVGAAWDDRTAAPEVAAVLARMVSEGKLKTEVVQKRGFLKTTENLRMELLVPRKSLSGYESILVNSLFFSGEVTDTEKIRKHYEDSGFDPASDLKEPLKQRVSELFSGGHEPRRISRAPTLLLLGASLLVLAVSAAIDWKGTIPVFPRMSGALLFYGIGFIAAAFYRRRVEALFSFALTFLVPAALLAGLAFSVVFNNPRRLGLLALVGFALFVLSLLVSVFNAAKFRQGSLALDLRRKLASARRYFAWELSKPEPRLDDRWFPYLIAFELGPDVDRWFRAHGPTDSTRSTSTESGSSSSGGSGGASTRWTGGGGAFGGAGATGSWAAAVGSVAAGVAAPSESSSGGGSNGGGGGGGSSGGGSGGGW